jgi:ABC-type Mn2+/Zn2+ transport system permease subunit
MIVILSEAKDLAVFEHPKSQILRCAQNDTVHHLGITSMPADSNLTSMIASDLAMAIACALLSVFVVLRHWALVGEGVSHSGFGGAGTAWLLAAFFPAFDQPTIVYAAVVVFCLVTAIAIGWVSRDRRVYPDAAIGIFLVASLAWGFLAQQIYVSKRGANPPEFANLLFGQITQFSPAYALAVICISALVVLTLWMLGKEVVSYSFDPLAARISGVRTNLIHNVLMLLIAAVIIISVRVVGTVLATALLVLPGTTALLLSRNLARVLITSVATSLVAVIVGLLIYTRLPVIPLGPAIVLALVLEFAVAYAASRSRNIASV